MSNPRNGNSNAGPERAAGGLGRSTGSGGGVGEPQVTDALGFASRLFEQIGNMPFSDEEEDLSSAGSGEEDDGGSGPDIHPYALTDQESAQQQQQRQQQQQQHHQQQQGQPPHQHQHGKNLMSKPMAGRMQSSAVDNNTAATTIINTSNHDIINNGPNDNHPQAPTHQLPLSPGRQPSTTTAHPSQHQYPRNSSSPHPQAKNFSPANTSGAGTTLLNALPNTLPNSHLQRQSQQPVVKHEESQTLVELDEESQAKRRRLDTITNSINAQFVQSQTSGATMGNGGSSIDPSKMSSLSGTGTVKGGGGKLPKIELSPSHSPAGSDSSNISLSHFNLHPSKDQLLDPKPSPGLTNHNGNGFRKSESPAASTLTAISGSQFAGGSPMEIDLKPSSSAQQHHLHHQQLHQQQQLRQAYQNLPQQILQQQRLSPAMAAAAASAVSTGNQNAAANSTNTTLTQRMVSATTGATQAGKMPISAIPPAKVATLKGTGGGVIDLTDDEPTTISDDEVSIDESKSTAAPNRNMCFGMIRSLVVTLYPRHLEYLEGIADPVVIKRSMTAGKPSLAVEHLTGDLYGYVVADLVESLIPLVDANMIWWEASVPRQRKLNSVSAPLNIILYGRPEHQMAVAKALHPKVSLEDPISFDSRTRYCNPLMPGPGEVLSPYDKWRGITTPVPTSAYNRHSGYGYGAPGYSAGFGGVQKSAEEIKSQIDGVFKGLRSATDLPEVEPAPTMATTMYRHQKQALYFLQEREKVPDYSDHEKNKLTSLWRVKQVPHRHPVYHNVVTNLESPGKPKTMKGGILADDMGLGKTITIIALIMASLDRRRFLPPLTSKQEMMAAVAAANSGPVPDFLGDLDEVTEYDSPPSPTIRPTLPSIPSKFLPKRRLNQRIKSHGTLIICPLSTVQNWEEQIMAHVKEGAVMVYVYHGGARVSDPSYLAKFDVVITTYNLLGTEYSKECKGRGGAGAGGDGGSDSGGSVKDSRGSKAKQAAAATPTMSDTPSALQMVDWFRVVLDEAHIIKEVSTVQSRAACALTADRRWCLSGTPIQNKLDDLYALLKFLDMEPFNDKQLWNHFISKPIKCANPIGVSRLQTLMKIVTLRRTKNQMVDGKPILALPPRRDTLCELELDPKERQLYATMESRAKRTVDEFVQENKIMKNYAHILQAILKLRQICAHYGLVKNLNDHDFWSLENGSSIAEFNLAKAVAILSLLQDTGNDQCNQCFMTCSTPIVTRCEHLVCPECVKKMNPICLMMLQRKNANISLPPGAKIDIACPQCSMSLKSVDMIQMEDSNTEEALAAAAAAASSTSTSSSSTSSSSQTLVQGHLHSRKDDNGHYIHSTKVKALMQDLVLANINAEESGLPLIKSVVFSQWTSMLDLIEDGLRENGIKFTRLDGTMQRSDRTVAMNKFKDHKEVTVILISMKAGGVGLNLTAAQRVYLMDPHWNPSVESQAIDRIHRLGQTKAVDVVRFIIKDSIEENILKLQKRKNELSDMTFSEKLSKQEVLKRRLEELKYLFNGSSELMGGGKA